MQCVPRGVYCPQQVRRAFTGKNKKDNKQQEEKDKNRDCFILRDAIACRTTRGVRGQTEASRRWVNQIGRTGARERVGAPLAAAVDENALPRRRLDAARPKAPRIPGSG